MKNTSEIILRILSISISNNGIHCQRIFRRISALNFWFSLKKILIWGVWVGRMWIVWISIYLCINIETFFFHFLLISICLFKLFFSIQIGSRKSILWSVFWQSIQLIVIYCFWKKLKIGRKKLIFEKGNIEVQKISLKTKESVKNQLKSE